MGSFSVEDFVGNGVLKDLLPTLLDEGWDDVPTLKVMNSEDMDAINMTRQQKVGKQYFFLVLKQKRTPVSNFRCLYLQRFLE